MIRKKYEIAKQLSRFINITSCFTVLVEVRRYKVCLKIFLVITILKVDNLSNTSVSSLFSVLCESFLMNRYFTISFSNMNFERCSGMPDEFVYRWKVDNVSKLTFRARRSPIFFHCDIPWLVNQCIWVNKKNKTVRFSLNKYLKVFRTIEIRAETSNRTNNIKNFCHYLFCNDEDDCDLWNVDTRATLSLIHRWDPEKNEVCEVIFRNSSNWIMTIIHKNKCQKEIETQ